MPVRIGLIGCGEYCSKAHAAYLANRDDVEIAAISGCISEEELARRQHQFHIPYAFSSYHEMLAVMELDGVVVSTPHTHHFIQLKHCLEMGLHVLIDKPPACTTAQVETLVDLAEAQGSIFLVASQRRYDPLFRQFRDTVQNGKLGRLRFASLYYGLSRHSNFVNSWRNDPSLSGGGVLFDAGYHMLDSLLWITNRQPVRVYGKLTAMAATVETFASLVLEFDQNASAHISVHLEMPDGVTREEIGFFGSEGALEYQSLSLPDSNSSSQVIVAHEGRYSCTEVQKDASRDYAPARNFVQAILGQEPVESPGKESIRTVQTIEWIYRELGRNGRGEQNETG